MTIEIQKELDLIEKAKEELNEKILSFFKDKWVLGKDCRRFLGSGNNFAKNKAGEFICFKVDKARLKSVKLASQDLASEIVLEGKDIRGAIRSRTIERLPGSEGYEYEVELFESEEEAILFATLKEQVEPSRF